jgi:GST-like protein
MIDLYYWPTPNGHKITIFAEEAGLEYRVIPVNIGRGEQFEPDFLAISPNNRMPAIVDHDGPDGKPISIFESGAILIYLAEKTGKFLPSDPRRRCEVLEWLMWQMGNVGPMLGQAHHFRMYAQQEIPYAIERYTNEATRLYRVLDKRLADREFVAGAYSIADMAILPWILPYRRQGQDIADYPNVERWRDTLKARPALRRGVDVGRDWAQPLEEMSEETRSILFGEKQFSKR